LSGVTLAQNEGVFDQSGPGVAGSVLHVDDVVGTGVAFTRNDDTNTTSVTTSGGHGEVSSFELGEILEGVGGKVDLNDVIGLNVGVRIADGTSVVGDDEGDALGAESNLADTAELELGLLGVDLVEGEAALAVVEQAEDLVGAVKLDDVHEAGRESGVSADFVVNLD